MKTKPNFLIVVFIIVAALLVSCKKETVVINNGDLQIEFNSNLYSRVNSLAQDTKPFCIDFGVSEYIVSDNSKIENFKMSSVESNILNDEFGEGEETILKGVFDDAKIELTKIISVKTYDKFPNMALFSVRYVNSGGRDLKIDSWVNNNYNVDSKADTPEFWSFNGSSSTNREDWIKPVVPGFYQKNFMGMNQSDYGGGVPVADLWRSDAGLAVGHVEMVPKEVSLPIKCDKYSNKASLAITYEYADFNELLVDDTLNTFSSFVMVHKGDYYNALKPYSKLMQAKGIKFVEPEEAAFESVWCGWGYERTFTADEIIKTLPKVKELGIKWAVIDDGYQIAEGDWRIDTNRFPGGTSDMKKIVKAIHDNGLKAKLWWAPMAADPGSKILKDKPEALLINKSGSPQYITWWDSYYLSPASEATIEYTKETVKMFMEEWGFDGLKLDGQHMNAVPPEYNWERPLEYPEKSIEMLPEFFKMIYHTARGIKPNAVIEHCPCGTCMSFYNMATTNQTVSSDPLSSWQIRLKGKTYKAIMPQAAYYGDHVELSDNGNDFASSFGIGAVLGTKFTYPKDNPDVKTAYVLTPEKEKIWKKWFQLYDEKMLSKETYLGDLYDIGYDKPETHVIQKGETMYYAFYADEYSGAIELRGLSEEQDYVAYDYVNEVELARFNGSNPQLDVDFSGNLLIAVSGY